jgi:hypothetical protein
LIENAHYLRRLSPKNQPDSFFACFCLFVVLFTSRQAARKLLHGSDALLAGDVCHDG